MTTNIEKLKEAIELLNLLNGSEKVETKKENSFEWEYVIVRWYNAWVWAGKLIDWTMWNIILEDARMLRYWWAAKGIWLSSLSVNGLNLEKKSDIKITETLKKVLINDNQVSTFFICTPEVEKQIREWEVAKQSEFIY